MIFVCLSVTVTRVRSTGGFFHTILRNTFTGSRRRSRFWRWALGCGHGHQPIRAVASIAPPAVLASLLDHHSSQVVDFPWYRPPQPCLCQFLPQERAVERGPQCLRTLPRDAANRP